VTYNSTKTYTKELDATLLHQPCLLRNVLEVHRIVEEFLTRERVRVCVCVCCECVCMCIVSVCVLM